MADIEGDEFDNTLNGTSGSDNIKGKSGNDTLNGSGGEDTISGGAGDDDIDGGSGNDVIFGGAGDDVITGGAGDDLIIGGRGNDTLTAGNSSPSDTFLIRDGDGNDTITDFDPPEPDIIQFDMEEISTFQDVVDRMSVDGPDTLITYDNGSFTRLQGVNPDDLTSTNFTFGPGPVCLLAGTMIDTPSGVCPIEDLTPGTLVTTLDHGPQPVIAVIKDVVRFRSRHDRRRPIMVRAAERGRKDISVSPQHRFLLESDELIPAVKLIERPGIRRMRGVKSAVYVNLILDRHEIISANGWAVETMLVTDYVRTKIKRVTDTHFHKHKPMSVARRISGTDCGANLRAI